MVRGLVEKMKIQISKSLIATIIIVLGTIAIQTLTYETARFLGNSPLLISSSIDEHIPFLNVFIYPYVTWYLMLFLVPLIMYIAKPQNFYSYTLSVVIAVIIAFIVFVTFPTTVNRPEINATDFTSYITNLIFSMDSPPGCCLPSMHCTLSFMFILYTIKVKELKPHVRVLIAIWSIVIIISTLYIKQHVIYDVLAAFILVLISHAICKKFKLYKITEKLHSHLSTLISKD